MFTLTFLGTSAGNPSKTRWCSSLAISDPKSNIVLVDAAEGCQYQFMHTASLKWSRITTILITHMHTDHVGGLAPLLSTMGQALGYTTAEEVPVVRLVGPPGIHSYVYHMLHLTFTKLPYTLVVLELEDAPVPESALDGPKWPFERHCEVPEYAKEESDWLVLETVPAIGGVWTIPRSASEAVDICAMQVVHSVPCWGYSIKDRPKRGKLNVEYVKPLLLANRAQFLEKGVKNPMALCRNLTKGEKIELPNGGIIDPDSELVMGAAQRGVNICVLGDSYDSSNAVPMVSGCDVLVHEATKTPLEEETEEDVHSRAVQQGHSTSYSAGKFAGGVGAKSLIMNHFSPRFGGHFSNPEHREVMEIVRKRAVEGSASTDTPCKSVLVAWELAPIHIKREGEEFCVLQELPEEESATKEGEPLRDGEECT